MLVRVRSVFEAFAIHKTPKHQNVRNRTGIKDQELFYCLDPAIVNYRVDT